MIKNLLVISVLFFGLNVNAQLLTPYELDTATLFKSIEDAMERHPDSVHRLKLRKKFSEFPEEILKFRNLNELILIKNNLVEVPDEIMDLQNLQILKVIQNKIDHIPVGICSLPNLRELNLSQNEIVAIPIEIGNLKKVEVVDISYNNIEVYPDELGNLKSLRKLQLVGMLMSYEEQSRIKKLIKKIPGARVFMSPPCNCSF